MSPPPLSPFASKGHVPQLLWERRPWFQHITAPVCTLWWNLCTSLLYFVVRVRCRRTESSRSLSYLLMTFLYIQMVQLLMFICLISITDLFDKIRTHPYVNNIIEKITSGDLSDYLLSPSEWHAKLLSYMDTVDNKIRQMMQHPRFISARDRLHATIQNVSCTFLISMFQYMFFMG